MILIREKFPRCNVKSFFSKSNSSDDLYINFFFLILKMMLAGDVEALGSLPQVMLSLKNPIFGKLVIQRNFHTMYRLTDLVS